jgi:CBS domain-containing protein
MPTELHNTPLFALDAVVLDTETTGLDPRNARIIEIGAVTIGGGRIVADRTFQSFVATDEIIPAGATAIHGITAQDLTGAPPFAAVYRELNRFVGARVVIGHTLGFDLALLKRECERVGEAPPEWPILDVRLMAEIAAPTLANFSVDALGAWLGVRVRDRHRGVGDALITAEIYLRLAPKLRTSGIRTAGEAARACARLTSVLDHYHRAGWVEPTADLIEADRHEVERRLDSYPYRHRVRHIMSAPPVHAADDESVREALARMVDAPISCLLIGVSDAPAGATGIVTERDLLKALHDRGPVVLDEPVGALATRPLITVPAEAFVYRAIGRMRRFQVRHLAATDGDGRVLGVVSVRDLLRARADAAIVLGDDIDEALDEAALARAWAKVPAMVASLVREEVGARDVAGMIAAELGALTRRAGELAEKRLAAEGRGPPPCPYALLVLGSAGRGESLLALDQDHAIVFSDGVPDGPEDRWFAELGKLVSDILHQVGVPYCKGGVMAYNAPFRGSMHTWRERITRWIGRARPEDLLNVDIFYDMRPVHGDGNLAGALWDEAWDAARGHSAFLKLLAEANAVQGSPFGIFGQLRRDNGRMDLKLHGLRPIVSNARLLALRHGIRVRATVERLEGVKALRIGGIPDLEAAVVAYERILTLILRAQIADIAAGQPASNLVPLRIAERHGGVGALKADLRCVAVLDDVARDQLA